MLEVTRGTGNTDKGGLIILAKAVLETLTKPSLLALVIPTKAVLETLITVAKAVLVILTKALLEVLTKAVPETRLY